MRDHFRYSQVPRFPARGRAAPREGGRDVMWGQTYTRRRRARDVRRAEEAQEGAGEGLAPGSG